MANNCCGNVNFECAIMQLVDNMEGKCKFDASKFKPILYR